MLSEIAFSPHTLIYRLVINMATDTKMVKSENL